MGFQRWSYLDEAGDQQVVGVCFRSLQREPEGWLGTGRHWGVFYSNGSSIYEIDLFGRTTESRWKLLPTVENDVPYKGKVWCVVAEEGRRNRMELGEAVAYAYRQGNHMYDVIRPKGRCWKGSSAFLPLSPLSQNQNTYKKLRSAAAAMALRRKAIRAWTKAEMVEQKRMEGRGVGSVGSEEEGSRGGGVDGVDDKEGGGVSDIGGEEGGAVSGINDKKGGGGGRRDQRREKGGGGSKGRWVFPFFLNFQ